MIVSESYWLHCPVCGNKIRTDTELKKFPLFCPKCKQENLINVYKLKMEIIKEPDT